MSYAPLPFPVDKLSIARGRADVSRPTPRPSTFDFIGHDSPFTQLAEKRTAGRAR